MTRFGVIGAGWRAEFYLRIAALRPEEFKLTGIYIRNPDTKKRFSEQYNVRICESLDELLETGCEFVVCSVNNKSIADMVIELAGRGVPVLTETPAGTSVEEIARLKALMQPHWRVQVAEQFHLQPRHAALIKLARSGILGEVRHMQISICHGYHAVSLIRHYLGTSYQKPEIERFRLTDKKLVYKGRPGIMSEPQETESQHKIAILRFGEKSALFDFCDGQYFSDIRSQRLVIRGTKGEIVNDVCTYLDGVTPMRFSLTRDFCGANGNLDGLYLRAITGGGQVLYRNPFPGARFNDEEVAVASCLKKMKEYLDGGEPFYPLTEGMLDAEISLQL